MLNLKSKIMVNEHISSATVDSEIVMLDMERGSYFALNAVGTYIFELLKENTTIEEICAAVVRTFDVEVERCEKELFDFLGKLHAENIVTII